VNGGSNRQLADYVSIIRRRWVWVLVPVLLLTSVSVVLGQRQPLRYQASTVVLIRDSSVSQALGGGTVNPNTRGRILASEVSYAQSDRIVTAVRDELGVVPTIEIEADSLSELLTFTATANSPEEAAQFADTWAEVYVSAKESDAVTSFSATINQFTARLGSLREERREVRAPLDALRQNLAALPRNPVTGDVDEVAAGILRDQISQLDEDLATELALIRAREEVVAQSIASLELQAELARLGTSEVVNAAEIPQSPLNPPLARNAIVGMLAGAFLGVVAALMREDFDRRLRRPDDVVRAVGLPVLTVVPRQRRQATKELGLATISEPDSPVADAYHKLRTSIRFLMVADQPIRSVLITSPSQGEGKTVTSANLAWALTALAPNVALVDCDFRRPRIHHVYGLPNDHGITTSVMSGAPVEDMTSKISLDGVDLDVITTGPPPRSPSEFVSSAAFEAKLRTVIADADLAVVDGPPVLPVSDAMMLARQVDAVIVVVNSQTSRDALKATIDSLNQVNARLLGVVLVGSKEQPSYSRYTYGDQPATLARSPEIRVAPAAHPVADSDDHEPQPTEADPELDPTEIRAADPATAEADGPDSDRSSRQALDTDEPATPPSEEPEHDEPVDEVPAEHHGPERPQPVVARPVNGGHTPPAGRSAPQTSVATRPRPPAPSTGDSVGGGKRSLEKPAVSGDHGA
jgi:capsular exopolysaccharide synthesis family protein